MTLRTKCHTTLVRYSLITLAWSLFGCVIGGRGADGARCEGSLDCEPLLYACVSDRGHGTCRKACSVGRDCSAHYRCVATASYKTQSASAENVDVRVCAP